MNNKNEKHVTLQVGDTLWEMLAEVHREFGVNKSLLVRNVLEHHVKHKKDLLVGATKEMEARRNELLRQAKELEVAIQETQGQIVHSESILDVPRETIVIPEIKSSAHAIGLDEERKEITIRENVRLTQEFVDALPFATEEANYPNGKKTVKERWVHCSDCRGLSVKQNKESKVYYTRAINKKVQDNLIKCAIGDTRYITLEQAKQVHTQNMEDIYKRNQNPNRLKNLKDKTKKSMSEEDYKKITEQHWSKYDTYRYGDLEIMGVALAGTHVVDMKNVTTNIRKKNKALSSQALDLWRQTVTNPRGDLTIQDLRRLQPYDDGSFISAVGMLHRLCKFIWHYGTKNEKELLFFEHFKKEKN
tara:strand:- start:477 stop:1556 length:1080 start_codon:yes stop_codon:yes gene_type:complete